MTAIDNRIVIDEALTLRPAVSADAEYLFSLKNEEEAKKSSIITKQGVTWGQHVQWLGRALTDSKMRLYVILREDVPAGSWRYDFVEDHIECSMIVAPEFRGQHIGNRIFARACDLIQEETGKDIICKVVEGNVAPMRYHIHANFLPVSYDREHRYYRWHRPFNARSSRKICERIS